MEDLPHGQNQNTDIAAELPVSSDASYGFSFAEDGVYIEIEKERGEGVSLNTQSVLYDIERRKINDVNIENAKHCIRRGGRSKIAEQQEAQPADSDVFVQLGANEMSAVMILLPPVITGVCKTDEEILAAIKEKWNVVYGINEDLVRAAVKSGSYYRPLVFAGGKAPEKGKDGELVFLFNTKHSIAPKILEDGSADYKNLNIFESVAEGAEVAKAIPPEPGIDGCSVTGKVLPAQKGAERKLPKGRNVNVSADGGSLLASKSGRVDYINGRVEISDVYKVKGDIDMGVGNVSFEGDVIVNGNIISGLTVQASGLIEVRGYVEAATLISGKDIILRNGMQGMGQGRLEAEGNIVARFIERSTLSAKGNIIADYIVQCIATAGGSVTMKGKWGKILGGVVRSGKEVTARIIGSPSNDRTQLELGILPDERARYTKLDKEKGEVKAQLNRVNNIIGVMPAANLPPEKQAMYQKLLDTATHLEEQYESLTLEIEELRMLLNTNSGARVNVLKTIYPNVRIQIDSGILTTNSPIEFATFRFKDGEVAFTACEIRS